MTNLRSYARRLLALLFTLALGIGTATAADTVTYYHTDALGTPVMESNAAGTVVYAREHRPYGEQSLGAAKNGPGFTGHVGDGDTGLTYMQARYYDPTSGRFLSNDPLQPDMATGENNNRYWYAANNPYKFVDPDGRDIRFAPGTPPDVMRNFAAAVRYLNAKQAANGIGIIFASKEVVTIRAANDRTNAAQSGYDANTNELTWADKGGVEVKDSNSGKMEVMTPALVLGHEFEHAMNDFYGSIEMDYDTFDSQYDNQEERNVIEDYERPAAERLGEPQREDHKGAPVEAKCSVKVCP